MDTKKPMQAKSWVERAKAFYRNSGREVALAEYTSPKGQFVDKGLYVFALDLNGTMLAHGVNERYIGKNFMDLKDSDGKSFIREIVETARKQDSGVVEYKWYHPVSKKEFPKTVYFEKVDDTVICCGEYKETPDPSDLELL